MTEAGEAAGAASPRGAALLLQGVVKRYGERTVLDAISLAVRPGELVALLGPNGAGKTTAVEILEGYRAADGGSVRVLGEDPRWGGAGLRARLGHMLQGGGLDPRSTPRALLRLYRRFHAGGRDPDALLETVGLGPVAGTTVRRLSGGERQRLALGLALVGDPEVLILDEPTAGMDPEARRATRALVAGLRDEGRAILITTHDLGDVERLADRVAILHRGRIAAEGPPATVAGGAAAALRLSLDRPLSDAERADLAAAVASATPRHADVGPVDVRAVDGPGIFVVEGLEPNPDVIVAVATWASNRGVRILELRAAGGSLEERYLELTDDRDVERVA